jgi:hypothetical protein
LKDNKDKKDKKVLKEQKSSDKKLQKKKSQSTKSIKKDKKRQNYKVKVAKFFWMKSGMARLLLILTPLKVEWALISTLQTQDVVSNPRPRSKCKTVGFSQLTPSPLPHM